MDLESLNRLVIHLPDAAILLDEADGEFVYNPAFVRFSGLRNLELRKVLRSADDPFDVFGTNPKIDRRNAQDCLRRGQAIRLAEVEVRNATGSITVANVCFIPVDSDDAMKLLYMLQDVSAESALQRKYRKLIDNLEERVESLQSTVQRRELELTGALQSSFFPKESTYRAGNLRARGYYSPAEICSGDWWWWESLENDRSWFLICDVLGHGAPAAMVTAALSTAVQMQSSFGDIPVTDRLRLIHEQVKSLTASKCSVTATSIEICNESGECTFISAGGMPILVLSQGKVEPVVAASRPLGSGDFSTSVRRKVIKRGQRVLMFSDGFVEIRDGARTLGLRGIADELIGGRVLDFGRAFEALVNLVERYRAGAQNVDPDSEDDVAFVFLEAE